MDAWESAAELAEKSEGAKGFIKLKSGEFVECVFRGAPYTFYQKFKDTNEYTEPGEGRSLKFRINVILKENSSYTAKIFQQGVSVLKDIISVRNEYGLDCVYKIKREGAGKDDTRYMILFKSNLTEEQKKLFNSIDLLELKTGKTRKDPSPEPVTQAVESDIPF